MKRSGLHVASRGAFAALFFACVTALPVQAQAPAKPLASVAPRDARVEQAQADVARKPAVAPRRDVFAPHSWLPPPAPPPKPVPPVEIQGPPAPPPPPPLTFAYLGQLDVQGEPTVYYLAQGERVLLVKIGDTIDGVYRLLAQEGAQLALVYLPLNAKQLLPLNRPQS